ncbi:TIGR04255 family protein [Mycobacterium sp. Lab-001]|uniref:TIGR04255 family protein n=1 Tax=Mycobacterium sp. Lab-001 TaxID=3410136 RepID=UPI003D186FF1
MYADREVFPNSPLALVTTEVRLTDTPRLRQQETLDNVAIALEGRFPISKPLTSTNVTFNVGNVAPGVAPQPQVEQERQLLLTNKAKTESVLLTPSSFVCETTAYREFDDFRANVAAVCNALVNANVRSGLVRVGIRYIDEVRVPDPIQDARGWGKWISSCVLGPLAVGPDDVTVTNAQGLVTFDLGDGMGLNFQHAALNQAPIVQPQFLNRRKFDPGPFFVLDFDGFRDFGGQDAVLLDSHEVTDVLTAVNDPLGAAFQNAITDEARKLFRGETA